MIRIIAGVDSTHYPNSLRFLVKLRFATARVHLMHVVEALLPGKSFEDLGSDHPLNIAFKEKKRQGLEHLANAEEMLRSSDYEVGRSIKTGDPARCLIEAAHEESAELIAVGSAQKGHWGSLFYGSIAKSLTATANSSLLIAKSPPTSDDGLKAVLATDHSHYCNQCINRFFEFQIKGVRHVTVLTSLNPKDAHRIGEVLHEGEVEAMDFEHIFTATKSANEELCDRLNAQGIECDSIVSKEHPQDAIASAMKNTSADLLILGAQGHGAWDRFRMGSLSNFQVVATPHNILIMRV